MIKVMLKIAQNFSKQKDVDRVLKMLRDILAEVEECLANTHTDETDAIKTHEHFVSVCTTTIRQCQGRIKTNTEELARNKKNDALCEKQIAKREKDKEDAEGDLASEEKRWDSECGIHENIMG